MKTRFSNLLIHFYSTFLRLYPQGFRVEFEDEMRAVFSESLEQAAREGLLSLADTGLREMRCAPLILVRVHWFSWKKRKVMGDPAAGFSSVPGSFLPPPPPDGRESWAQAGLEASPFLLVGSLLVLLTYLPFGRPVSGLLRSPGSGGTVFFLLAAAGFLFGLARGLPRWGYPFGGVLLGYGLLGAIRFDVLPLLVAFLLAFVLLAIAAAVVHSRCQPLPPALRRVWQSVRLDWSRLSWCVYGIMPLLIVFVFDDSRCNNRTPFLALSVLFMVAGGFVYIRSRGAVLQMTALLGGVSLSLCCALLDRVFLSGLEAWLSFPGLWLAEIGWMVKLWVGVTVLIVAPFLIIPLHRALTPGRAA
jgi:hypothetical protein